MTATEDVTAAAAGSLRTSAPPTFATVEEERLHRKQRLAGAFRIFGRMGFGEGVAGHITCRDPELTDHFWVNPFGMSFRHVRVSDLLLVNHRGDIVHGDRPLNLAAFVIHSAIHKARPDVIAAAHSHSTYGRAWSALGRTLDPITQDACAFFEDHVVATDGGGKIVLEADGGESIARELGGHKAAIHRNHGLITVGGSVDECVWWYVTMERSCQVQLLAEAAGTPHHIPAEDARYTRQFTGTPTAGWFSFQPLWDEVCRTDPDLFD